MPADPFELCFDTSIHCPACGQAISVDFETCPEGISECGGGGEGTCSAFQEAQDLPNTAKIALLIVCEGAHALARVEGAEKYKATLPPELRV